MKSKRKIFILLLLLACVSFTSLSIFAAPASTTLIDDMDGNYTPTSTENLTVNAQTYYKNMGGFLFSGAIDSTLAMPTSGDTAALYYSAYSFDSVEVNWYSSFGAFVTKENGSYRIGGDPTQALDLPLYISDMDGDTHFYIVDSTGTVLRTDYITNPSTPIMVPYTGFTPPEVQSMKQVGASIMGNTFNGWLAPSSYTHEVTVDTGADPPLYYHTLKASLPADTSTVKISFTGLDLFPDFADSYYFDLPILTALGRVRATGNLSAPSSDVPSLDSSEVLSSTFSSVPSFSESSPSASNFSSNDSNWNTSSQISSEPSTPSAFSSISFSSNGDLTSAIPSEGSNYPWAITAGTPSFPDDRGRSVLGNNEQIEGYVPFTANEPSSPLQSTAPNFNPNWGGTRIIRPHTILSEPAILSSEKTENDTSSYTVITGSTTTQNNSVPLSILLGVSSISLTVLGFSLWKTKKR